MNCINCQHELRNVKLLSHYGAVVDVEQCPECGGVWFDADEIYHAKHGEALKLKDINPAILKNDTPISTEALKCPRDNEDLKIFKDPNWPSSIVVEHCSKCGGFWFNRGEFADFQNARQEKKKEREQNDIQKPKDDDELIGQVSRLLEGAKSGENSGTLGNLGKFLSLPGSGRIAMPLTKTVSLDIDKGLLEAGAAIGMVIIQALLRLIILKR